MALDGKRFRKNTRMQSEQDLCISSTQMVLLDDPCATTYKKFGYVAIYQIGKIDICWSSNIAICQPCNTAFCKKYEAKNH